MQPKDNGGVVDTNLVVYGTSNLRVVDASIMPLQARLLSHPLINHFFFLSPAR
jgi:hypothetical protein